MVVQFHGAVLIVLLWRATLSLCEEFDQSTLAYCPGDQFPEMGTRVCYRRSLAPDECNVVTCSVEVINRTRGDIVPLANTMKIASPRFYQEGGIYQNQRLCQYHVQDCPAGTIAHIEWSQSTFMLEEPRVLEPFEICLDYVKIFRLDLSEYGVQVDDLGRLCASPEDFSMRVSGVPLQIEFRSDTSERFRGFRMDIICAPLVSDTAAGASEDDDDNRRKRRRSSDGTIQTRKGAVSYRTTDMKCVEVMGPPIPQPPPVDFKPLPLNQTRFRIPRSVFLEYWEETLSLVQEGRVVEQIPDIQRLIFWTGFNGTRIFVGNAPVPPDEIFGGGQLLLVKGCAYYSNFMSPPRLEPNLQELAVISILTNATAPFFTDQDIEDEEEEEPTTATPTTRPHYYKPYYTPAPPTTPPPDPYPKVVVDPEALKLALQFENACNIYLRQAARSLLALLKKEGLLKYY